MFPVQRHYPALPAQQGNQVQRLEESSGTKRESEGKMESTCSGSRWRAGGARGRVRDWRAGTPDARDWARPGLRAAF